MAWSPDGANAFLSHVFLGLPFTRPSSLYLALLTELDSDREVFTELTDSGVYERKQILSSAFGWAASGPFSVTNVAEINLGTPPVGGWVGIVAVGLFTEPVGGQLWFSQRFPVPQSFGRSGNAVIAPGMLSISIDIQD